MLQMRSASACRAASSQSARPIADGMQTPHLGHTSACRLASQYTQYIATRSIACMLCPQRASIALNMPALTAAPCTPADILASAAAFASASLPARSRSSALAAKMTAESQISFGGR